MSTTTTTTTTHKDALVDALVHMLHGADISGGWPVRAILGEEVYAAFGSVAGAMIRAIGFLPAEREEGIKQQLNWALRVIDKQLGTELSRDYEGRGFDTEGILRLRLDDVLELQRAIAYGTATDFVLRFWALYDPLY
jgi:hypothetical protein